MDTILKISRSKIDIKRILPILIVIVFTIPATFSLFKTHFFSTHDGISHVVRFAKFYQSFIEGNIIPSWIDGVAFNLGSPVLLFNSYLPYYAALVFKLLGFSFDFSIEIIFALSLIFSGVAFYYFAKDLFGEVAGITGAILYVWAPYRFLDIYVRGAYPESFAFIFPPLIFLSIKRFLEEKSKTWLVLSIFSITGLILSHNPMTVMFGGLGFIYGIYLALMNRDFRGIFRIITIFILAFLVCSFYLLPAFFEKQYTNLDKLNADASYYVNFISLNQLIYSRWGWGPLESDSPMSLQLGFGQWVSIILSALIIGGIFLNKKIHYLQATVLFFLICFLVILFFTQDISVWFWENLGILSFILYPWRLIALLTFIAAIAASFVVFSSQRFKYPLLLFLVFLSIYANRNHSQLVGVVREEQSFYNGYNDTTDIWGEFLTKWIDVDEVKKCKKKGCYFKDIEGIEVFDFSKRTGQIEFSYKTKSDQEVVINRYFFPGWKIYLDSKTIGTQVNNAGRIGARLPGGEHRAKVVFEDTFLRMAAKAISLVAIVLLFIYVCFQKRLKRFFRIL